MHFFSPMEDCCSNNDDATIEHQNKIKEIKKQCLAEIRGNNGKFTMF